MSIGHEHTKSLHKPMLVKQADCRIFHHNDFKVNLKTPGHIQRNIRVNILLPPFSVTYILKIQTELRF